MNVNYYKIAREWPYKNVPHLIIAEPFLGKQDSPNDYKFFCFNGKVKYFKVDFNRFSNHFANYYNRSGELQHFGESAIPTSESIKLTIPKKFLDEMISRAEVLSRDAKFMRVDFYSENENVWFGECTLYPAAGFNPLTNNSMELDWGGQSADCQQVASRDITDYKFFCFDGEPKVMYIGSDRSEHSTSDFFDMGYKHLPIQMKDPNADVMPQKPITFNKMKDLAKVLSQGLPEVRVDFYNDGTNIYFGEMTFFHCAGFTPIKPREWEFYFGDWIKIN